MARSGAALLCCCAAAAGAAEAAAAPPPPPIGKGRGKAAPSLDTGFVSGQYWDDRYKSGDTSGFGSYSRLALYKANFLNWFMAAERVRTVIEFGSGDGAQLRLLNFSQYMGVDVSPTIVARSQKRFGNDPRYRFMTVDKYERRHRLASSNPRFARDLPKYDAALSLDVVYHLIEDDVFDAYMARLFSAASRYVVVYASDCNYRLASRAAFMHVKHRAFTPWVQKNAPAWSLLRQQKNPYFCCPSPVDSASCGKFCSARTPRARRCGAPGVPASTFTMADFFVFAKKGSRVSRHLSTWPRAPKAAPRAAVSQTVHSKKVQRASDRSLSRDHPARQK